MKDSNLSFVIIKVILVLSIAYSIYAHSWRILFVNLLLLLLIFIPSIIRRVNIEVPKEIEFILLLFVVISFFLGDLRGLVIQIFFGLAIGFVGFAFMTVLYKNSKLKPNFLLIFIFSLSISLAIGSLSEISKYYLKIYLNYAIDISDYEFAMQSLSLVFLGTIFAIVSGFFYLKGGNIFLINSLVEKFKTKNPNLFVEKHESPEEILQLIKKGENEKLEFKSTLRTNLHTHTYDKNIELTILKSISGFLNTEGGTLLIGVSDTGEIFGIEKDTFPSNDKFNLHFTNLVKEHIGNEFIPYLHFEIYPINGKHIMKVSCMKSHKPVFVKYSKLEDFYARVGASTIQLTGSKLVDYIKNNFR